MGSALPPPAPSSETEGGEDEDGGLGDGGDAVIRDAAGPAPRAQKKKSRTTMVARLFEVP